MTKMIVRDYFRAFRWGNFKDKVAKSLYFVLYLSVILPCIADFFEKWKYALVYFLVLIPSLHIYSSGRLHDMKMPKMMYMVPLTQDMKREYIVKSAIFRICFCSLFGMLCTFFLILIRMCGIITYVLLVYEFATFALLLCGMKQESKSDCRTLIQGFDIFLTVLILYGITFSLCWDNGVENIYVNMLFVIPAIVLQLPLTIKYMSNWNNAVEMALNYETSFDK